MVTTTGWLENYSRQRALPEVLEGTARFLSRALRNGLRWIIFILVGVGKPACAIALQSGRRGGHRPRPPHHRTCGAASGGSPSTERKCAKAPFRSGAGAGGDPSPGSGWASPTYPKSKASCLVFCLIPGPNPPVVPCGFLFGPSRRSDTLHSGTMASADSCLSFPYRCRYGSQSPWQIDRPPGITTTSVTPPCRIYPGPVLEVSGFTVSCQLTLCPRPTIRSVSLRSSLWLRLPSDLTSR